MSDINVVSDQITNLINTPIEENFERLARLAKRMFEVPSVAVSLFDEKRQWVKPVVAIDLGDIADYMEFFNECISDDILVVEDTLKNDRFSQLDVVKNDPRLRFFVNCPIYEKHGKKVGALILLDFKPRHFGLTDLTNLNDIVKLIETEIKREERVLFIDEKTLAWNFEGFRKILDYQIVDSVRENSQFALAVIDIDNFKEINKKYGQELGDEILTVASKTILRSCRDEDTIARGKEEDFIVIIHAGNMDNIKTVVNRIQANIAKEMIKSENHSVPFKVTIGVSIFEDPQSTPADTLIQKARVAMLKGKRQGRNQIVFA